MGEDKEAGVGGDKVLTHPDCEKGPGTQFSVPVSPWAAAHERDHSLKPLTLPSGQKDLSSSRSIYKGLPKVTQLISDRERSAY